MSIKATADGDDDQESPLGRHASQFLQAARNRKTKEDVELIRLALHTNPFFTCMDEEQIERFIKAAEFKVYQPEQTVILEGYIDDDAGQEREDEEEEERQRQLLWDEKADVEPSEYLEEESMLDPTEYEHYGDTSEWQNNSGPGVTEEVQEEKPLNLRSGMPSYVYCIRSGAADVWHDGVNTASFGAGTIFGVGGFLFHRQHSATVVASPEQELECWAVPAEVFRDEVLPSENMVRMFSKYASPKEDDEVYMTMDEFIRSCTDREEMDGRDPRMKLRMANTFNILRKTEGVQKINLANFSLFHLLMARPDPEVDIAFLLMDDDRTGTISLANLRNFLELNEENQYFDLNCEFVRRHFGEDGKRCIRYHVFPQFLAELPKEMGRQAFLYEVDRYGSSEGYIGSKDFVRVLKTACGWRLPVGVGDRLENLYCREPKEAAEATARTAIASETLKGSNIKEKTKSTTASILANMEKRSKDLGDRCFAYSDFLAFQEVLGQLPGICNLIQGACAIKRGPISPDDFKVANRVIGLGGKLSRRQVEIVFQLFDLDQDGYIAAEDTASVVGVEFVYRLEAIPGREGKLTFAPPPDFRHDTKAHDEPEEAVPNPIFKAASEFGQKMVIGGLAGLFGAFPALILWPADMVKSRMQMDRIRHDGVRRFKNVWDCYIQARRPEGHRGMYRGALPFIFGVVPQRGFHLAMYFSFNERFGDSSSPYSVFSHAFGGACAGFTQALLAYSSEATKINLQLRRATEWRHRAPSLKMNFYSQRASEWTHFSFGTFKGLEPILLREVPFSATFFSAYSLIKQFLSKRHEDVKPWLIALVAGSAAAVPSSMLTMPADVINTRLKATHRMGDIKYDGIVDCAKSIMKYEGYSALFKGSFLRTLRLAPVLGVTMAAYTELPPVLGWLHFETKNYDEKEDFRTTYPTRAIGNKTEDIESLLGFMGVTSSWKHTYKNSSDANCGK